MAIGSSSYRIVREVAEMADLDYAAASKSLKLLLQSRGLVDIEQTQRRGRAAIASLTPESLALYRQLRASAQRRQRRFPAAFPPEEVDTLAAPLRRLEQQVPHLNAAGTRRPAAGAASTSGPGPQAPPWACSRESTLQPAEARPIFHQRSPPLLGDHFERPGMPLPPCTPC